MPEPPPPPGTLARRPATREEAAALASAIRLRILRLTYHDPLTNKEIAQCLGRDPATTLHHVRRLVDTGFLEVLPVRRGARGSREKPYRATGLSWALEPVPEDEAPGAEDAVAEAMFEAFLGEVADGVAVTGFAQLNQTRLALRLPPDELERLRTRLAELFIEFASLPVAAGEPLYGVYLAVHPITPAST